jgi:acyl dehydratase
MSAKLLMPGYYWQDLAIGGRFQTLKRTVTEADLINFISTTGMLEAIFIDAHYEGGAIAGRPVPGALTCALIEGMQFQTLLQGTGLAMLEMSVRAVSPVCVGDTIDAIIEITDIRPTSKGGRAVVKSKVEIFNQHHTLAMVYDVARLIKGRE